VSTNNLWSGRFDAAPDEDVFAYGKSLPVDKRLVEDDITGSAAWAQALNKAGVLSDADVAAMLGGLEAIRAAVRANPALIAGADDEDVHAFVEREPSQLPVDIQRRRRQVVRVEVRPVPLRRHGHHRRTFGGAAFPRASGHGGRRGHGVILLGLKHVTTM